MKAVSLLYVVNATLLLLHELESAYEKEWKILKLPGQISGFLIFHIPIIIFLFYGVIEIEKSSTIGFISGIIFGISGTIPFMVHKLFIKTPNQFNLPISNAIIYLNILSGIGLLFFSVKSFT